MNDPVIGVDGWKGKWVGVELLQGEYSSVQVFESLAEIAENPKRAVIAVDVPIGLPESGTREADAMARKRIGRRSSSVFNPPPAFVLDAKWKNYREANDESKKRSGVGISAQGFALMKNIREADALAREDQRFHEVHPEVTFCAMNGGKPPGFSKKSWNGQAERIALLRKHGIEIPTELSNPAVGVIPPDDLLDAAAAAWSANRIAQGKADAVPDINQRLERIWF